jgi:hypothetical protein
MYTGTLYGHRVDLYRYGFYDDLFDPSNFGGAPGFTHYDQSFLSKNRFGCKSFALFNIDVIDPPPPHYFYRTFYIRGIELDTGDVVRFAIHDGQVVGMFSVSTDRSDWSIYSGADPFIEGLSFREISISQGSQVVDLIYYTDSSLSEFRGLAAPLDRVRIFILRGATLDFVPPNPFVNYDPLTPLEEEMARRGG